MDPETPEIVVLVAALDRHLDAMYPGSPIEGIDPVEFRRTGGVFLLGRVDGIAVACGALRPMSPGIDELKRMYVREDSRGRGHARAMLEELERIAVARGTRAIRLGTGTNQPEAMRLYETAGYQLIPCFADYVEDPRSRCYEKHL